MRVEDPNLSFSNSKLGHKREVRISNGSYRRQNDVTFGGWKDKTISNNFNEDHLLKF
jgi:hypothetical protein